jgi:hypothetical protein
MFKDAMRAFLDLKKEEAILSKEGGKKVGTLAIGRFFYAVLDYLIVGGLGAMVVWMNTRGFSYTEIFLATWAYDLVAAYFFYFASDLSGYDITLANSFRRSADVIFENGIMGRIYGGLLLLGISLKAMIWEGPEVIYFLFRKELGRRVKFHAAMLILSFGQGFFGTWLYTTGYEMLKTFLPANVEFWHIILLAIAIFIIFTISVVIIKKLAQWVMVVIRFFWKASKAD